MTGVFGKQQQFEAQVEPQQQECDFGAGVDLAAAGPAIASKTTTTTPEITRSFIGGPFSNAKVISGIARRIVAIRFS